MSSREPLWFCHECHAEMRPLMVPDPVCASCRSSFVEKMENTADDPRQFAAGGDDFADGVPPGIDGLFLTTLQSLMDRGMGEQNTPLRRPTNGPSVTFEIRSPTGSRTVRLGGANTLDGRNQDGPRSASPDGIPNMSSFVRRPPPLTPFGIPLGGNPGGGGGGDHQNISGALMAQYLMALLGYHDPAMLGMPENGRMGDYVFNQEALDQIISQIMENSNAHRPVPASEEVIAKLPREVLTEGSPRLEQECAICKDQFKLNTEDPDEQIVVTLPCKHPFHQPCILPWLSSSGTCPVCRFQLVPQPEQHPPPPGRPEAEGGRSRSPPPSGPPRTSTGSPGPSQRPHTPPPQPSGAGTAGANGNAGTSTSRGPESGSGGLFHTLFGGLSGLAHPNHNQNRDGNATTTSPTAAPSSDAHTNHRPWSPSWGGTSTMRPRSPRPRSPPPSSHQRSPPHRRSSSDAASPHFFSSAYPHRRPNGPNANSSPNNNNNNNNSNPNPNPNPNANGNLPGGWEDELD